jgi:hypothetical protein
MTMAGLIPGFSYNFRAFYVLDETYYYGATLSFTTKDRDIVFEEPGFEYKTAQQAIDQLEKISQGRHYMDGAGNLQYESRFARAA